MAIEIKEYLGCSFDVSDSKKTDFSLQEAHIDDYISEDSIMVDIEGIHVGPTRNYTYYTEEALKSSIPSWTKPYQRPLILHHNEKDGKIIGRVCAATYTDLNTRSGTGALTFTCNVPDEEGIKGIKDGRLKTTSIGVIAHDVRCSICGQQLSDDCICEHERGNVYNNEVCYWMIYSMEAKELSYVIVPSDIYAHNVKVYKCTSKKDFKENSNSKGVLEMTKAKEIKESTEELVQVSEVDTAEVIVEDADKQEENKTESIDTLKNVIKDLKKVICDLEGQVKDKDDQLTQIAELKESVEQELIEANLKIKEFAMEQIMSLRENLGRPAIQKEKLELRTQESLIDTIADLKEELIISKGELNLTEANDTEKPMVTELKESATEEKVDAEEEKTVEAELSKIEKPLTESLVDEDKDTSAKNEKKSELDVKENMESSNSVNEEDLDAISKFYNIY